MTTETYDRIILSAMRLFAEHGYDGVGMSAIAEDVGVSKANLYHHFENKLDLLTKVLETAWTNFTIKEITSVDHCTKENYIQTVVDNGLRYLELLQRDPLMTKLILSLLPVLFTQPDLMKMFEPFMQEGFQRFHQMVLKGVEVGAISKDADSMLIAQQIFMIVDAFEMYNATGASMPLMKLWADMIPKILKA